MTQTKQAPIFMRVTSIFLLLLVYVFLPVVSLAAANPVSASHEGPDLSDGYNWNEFTVRICHYTGNGTYVNKFVNLDGAFHGHRKHANDIIPNLTYKKHGKHIYYAGKNWPAGEAIWRNNCNIVAPTPTPTVTPTTTPTATPTEEPTTTPTVTPTEEPTTTPTVTPTEEPTTTPTVTPTETTTVTPTPTETEVVTTTIPPTTTPTETTTSSPTPTQNTNNNDDDNEVNTIANLPPVTTPDVKGETTPPVQEVLGERTCDNKVKLIGITYTDTNKNNVYDFGEKLLSSITGKVTYNVETKEFFVGNFVSDNNGKWEMTVCPGEYNVTTNPGSLPKNVTSASDILKVNVLAAGETTIAMAFLENNKSLWSWWWVLLIVFALAVIYYLYRRRRQYLENHA